MLKPILLAFLMTLSSSLAAQDFNKGLATAQAGDFATALQEWKPLAEAGGTVAQYFLGHMYKRGQGVPQDYKEAAKIKGVYKGRPSSLDHDKIKELHAAGMGATAIARKLGCSRGAVYKVMKV